MIHLIITGAEYEEADSKGDMLSENIRFDESVVHFKVFFLDSDGRNS